MNRWRHGSRQHLAGIRTTLLVIWLIILLQTPYESYSVLPPEIVRGFGWAGWLLDAQSIRALLFSYLTLWFLRWSAIAATVLSLFRPSRWTLIWLSLDLFLLDGLTKSISGYPNHAQFCALMLVALFAAIDWKRSQEVEEYRKGIIWLAGLVLVLPYTFVGLNRVVEGGVDLFTGDTLLRWVEYTSRLYSAYSFSLPTSWLDQPIVQTLLRIGFTATTMLEIFSGLVLLYPRCRLVWVASMSAFHVLTLVTMRIFFWENLLLIWVIVGWGTGRRRERQTIKRLLVLSPEQACVSDATHGPR